MSHKPAARVGDATKCPKDNNPPAHVGGKIASGSSNITINGKPAARVGDAISGCKDGSSDAVAAGSGCVTFNGKPAARLSDATDHGGEITAGSGNVFIGNTGGIIEFGDYGVIEFGDYGKIYLGGEESSESPEATAAEVPPPDLIDKALDVVDKLESIPYLGKIIKYAPQTRGLKALKRLKVAKMGSYRPKGGLPRDKHGNPVPSSKYPHTQLGTKNGRNGDYTQAREWQNKNGKLVPKRDIDFTDHGRPGSHSNPHQHDWVRNQTGGTPRRTPGKPLE
jgi:uncharacterized Zn-binding protein involved in type VI secretion